MSEEFREMQAMQVRYRCDKCGVGWMKWGGMTLTSNPPMFPHICEDCGVTKNLQHHYPHIEYWEVQRHRAD